MNARVTLLFSCFFLFAMHVTPRIFTSPIRIMKHSSGRGKANNDILKVKQQGVVPTSIHASESSVNSSTSPNSHLLVFINKASGDLRGRSLLQSLRSVLHPNQICDLQTQDPKQLLSLWRNESTNLRILCCGGDGTVSWILSLLIGLNMSHVPVGVLPLGTGNDLSRYSSSQSGRFLTADEMLARPMQSIAAFSNPKYTNVDIWNVTCTPPSHMLSPPHTIQHAYDKAQQWKRSHFGKKRYYKNKIMMNYCGIGLDGAVTLEFSDIRHKLPQLFVSRFINKAWYGLVGLRTFLLKAKQDLSQVELRVDGNRMDIPKGTQGIIMLNVNSYAGGAILWSPSASDKVQPSADDGILEDMTHLGKITVGLDKGVKVGQGRDIEITTRQTLPMQIDGEPWRQRPCTMQLSRGTQAKIIVPN